MLHNPLHSKLPSPSFHPPRLALQDRVVHEGLAFGDLMGLRASRSSLGGALGCGIQLKGLFGGKVCSKALGSGFRCQVRSRNIQITGGMNLDTLRYVYQSCPRIERLGLAIQGLETQGLTVGWGFGLTGPDATDNFGPEFGALGLRA